VAAHGFVCALREARSVSFRKRRKEFGQATWVARYARFRVRQPLMAELCD
jgi:hypothetical protein